jgi:hypothetical protein
MVIRPFAPHRPRSSPLLRKCKSQAKQWFSKFHYLYLFYKSNQNHNLHKKGPKTQSKNTQNASQHFQWKSNDTSESRLHSELLSELWPSVKIWVDINVDVNSTTTSHWVWFLKPQRWGSQTQNVVQKPLRGSQHEFLHVLHHALLNSARWRANFTRGFGSEHPFTVFLRILSVFPGHFHGES